jgi:hypothetical protein
MRRRRFLGLALPVVAAGDCIAADSSTRPPADRIVLPPERRTFGSPSGRFVLTLETTDGWRSRRALATLQLRTEAAPGTLWQQRLPHEHGPRHVLVTDAGETVLVDEWIRVPSRRALTLLAADGTEIAAYGFDALVQLLGVPRRTVADHARLGAWLSAPASVAADGRTVRFEAAGRTLVLSLADGSLKLGG